MDFFTQVFISLRIMEMAVARSLSPLARLPQWIYKRTSLHAEEKKAAKIIKDFILEKVQERRKALQDDADLFDGGISLDYLLKTPYEGKLLTDEQVVHESCAFFLGFYDTTKSAITSVIYCLAKYPEVQKKVFEEVSLILKKDPLRDIEIADLVNMPYTEAVINEVMRLYTPIGFVTRKPKTTVNIKGYTFPAGTDVFFNLFAICRSPKYFDNPLEFRPERFLGVERKSPGFVAFCVGARKCLGQNHAIKTLKIMIAKIIFNLEISLVDENYVMQEIPTPMLQPLKPFDIQAVVRHQ
jgi:cytochrome P450 family 4